jgi:hypothetical protein
MGPCRGQCYLTTGTCPRGPVADGAAAGGGGGGGRPPPAAGGRRLAGQRAGERDEGVLHGRDPAFQVEPEIHRHLLVARTPGVQPLPRLANPFDQLPLDERVDVLVGTLEEAGGLGALLEDALKTPGNRARIRRVDGAGCGNRLHPREAPPHVVFEQAAVEHERPPELEHAGIGLAAEPSRPEIRHGLLPDPKKRPARHLAASLTHDASCIVPLAVASCIVHSVLCLPSHAANAGRRISIHVIA